MPGREALLRNRCGRRRQLCASQDDRVRRSADERSADVAEFRMRHRRGRRIEQRARHDRRVHYCDATVAVHVAALADVADAVRRRACAAATAVDLGRVEGERTGVATVAAAIAVGVERAALRHARLQRGGEQSRRRRTEIAPTVDGGCAATP